MEMILQNTLTKRFFGKHPPFVGTLLLIKLRLRNNSILFIFLMITLEKH